ncbi:hypothetical protein PI124_g13982 [Phytophthora idaei]|nr:hypothetical protein PI125_g13527 [Phytophthora idaei]KAG3149425.1 hypothetical protein PI126_g12014 [Phytophthora idaei]KAG3241133.1 hypothetical protein PI124_g13982 [Phytophthora idaei]
MTTASSSNATLLLVTGLLSVGMAAMGYFYLHMSSKKPSANDSETGVYNSVASVEKTEAATSIEAPKPTPPSPNKEVEKGVEAPVKKAVEPSVVAEAPKETAPPSPKNETPKSSPKKIAESPKKEVEPPVLELPKSAQASLKTTPESPKKVAENGKKEAELLAPNQAPTSPIKAPESPKKIVESPEKAPESPTKTPVSPKKIAKSPTKNVAESAPAVDDAVTRMLCEDLIISQAVTETANAFTEELVQESLENMALEQEEYVQVELTQSMTLSQSTPELINIVAKSEEEVAHTSAATQDEESIVEEEEQEQAFYDQESSEPVVEEAEDLASPKSPNAQSASWEAITSPEVKAAPAEETPTPLSLDTPAESAEPLSINVPVENTEAPAQDKDASSPVSSGGSSPGSKRNRNRSKKSKSKRKKSKKHPKFKA